MINVVVGGQFGSEGKGHVAHRLLRRRPRDGRPVDGAWSVRVGGPNAGHTVYDDEGRRWPLRQLPVGVITPGVVCMIAAGSEVDLLVLEKELSDLQAAGFTPTVWLSSEATILTAQHRLAEQIEVDGGWVASTAKGIGAARSDRLWRRARRVADLSAVDDPTLMRLYDRFPHLHELEDPTGAILDTVRTGDVVIEGTQGFGLGLHSGYYPNTTSGDCRAIDVLAQAGVNPWVHPGINVWLCVRPNPIRIAGGSGPLKGETTWEALGLPQEHTTVTHKVRRVGAWDPELVQAAIWANGGPWGGPWVRLALTMADHLVPGVQGQTETTVADKDLEELTRELQRLESTLTAQFWLATTGPNTGIWL